MPGILLGDAGCPVRTAREEGKQFSLNWGTMAPLVLSNFFFLLMCLYVCLCECIYVTCLHTCVKKARRGHQVLKSWS